MLIKNQDDCDGCKYHGGIGIFGYEWCRCEQNKKVHDEIENEYRGKWIGKYSRIVPSFNKVHGVCECSTNPQIKEGDLTLDLTEVDTGDLEIEPDMHDIYVKIPPIDEFTVTAKITAIEDMKPFKVPRDHGEL